MHVPTSTSAGTGWTRSYEIKAVALLSLGFGLVGLDRFIINPLFPVMSKDLGLNYQHLGLISAVLALAWGLSSIFTGHLSDRVGRKRVLIPAVVIFSVLVAASGLASGLASLLMIRALMGLSEGAYVPASIVATQEASHPRRIGLNIGIQQMAAPLVGLGFGPVVAVGLLKVLPNWHWVFGVVAVPGLLTAALMYRILKNDAPLAHPSHLGSGSNPVSWKELLRHRAVIVNTLCMFCWLTCLIVLTAFMPNYLTDHLKLSMDQMGMVLAGQGLGSFVGMVAVPAISDRIGRKSVMVVALVIELISLWLLTQVGADPFQLFVALFVSTFMVAGVVAITVGPLTSGAIPAHMATGATGIVVGLGEVVGGAVAPAIAGGLAQQFGITIILNVVLYAIALGLVIVLIGVREPKGALNTAIA